MRVRTRLAHAFACLAALMLGAAPVAAAQPSTAERLCANADDEDTGIIVTYCPQTADAYAQRARNAPTRKAREIDELAVGILDQKIAAAYRLLGDSEKAGKRAADARALLSEVARSGATPQIRKLAAHYLAVKASSAQ